MHNSQFPMRRIVKARERTAGVVGYWDILECGHRLPSGSAFKRRHCTHCGKKPPKPPKPTMKATIAAQAATIERLQGIVKRFTGFECNWGGPANIGPGGEWVLPGNLYEAFQGLVKEAGEALAGQPEVGR